MSRQWYYIITGAKGLSANRGGNGKIFTTKVGRWIDIGNYIDPKEASFLTTDTLWLLFIRTRRVKSVTSKSQLTNFWVKRSFCRTNSHPVWIYSSYSNLSEDHNVSNFSDFTSQFIHLNWNTFYGIWNWTAWGEIAENGFNNNLRVESIYNCLFIYTDKLYLSVTWLNVPLRVESQNAVYEENELINYVFAHLNWVTLTIQWHCFHVFSFFEFEESVP